MRIFLVMSEVLKSVTLILLVFGVIGSIIFYFTLTSGFIRIIQGDNNAVRDIEEVIKDEVISTIRWEFLMAIIGVVVGIYGIILVIWKVASR